MLSALPGFVQEYRPQVATTGYSYSQLRRRGGRIPDSQFPTSGNHFSLFFTIDQAVLILHRNKLCPTVFVGNVLESDKLISKHRRRTDITDFAHGDEIKESAFFSEILTVKSLHSFFAWSIVIVSVDLKNVDVICSQPFQTCLNCLKNVLSTQTYE